MKEKDLIRLGFTRNDETAESSGCAQPWHYYTMDFGCHFTLITNDSDDAAANGWHVILFDHDNFLFKDAYQLEKLIEILKYNEVQK